MFFTTSIDESPVREFAAGENLTALTAVELTADGLSIAGASSIPLGLTISDVEAGDSATIQLEGGGLWLAGESLAAGDFLSAGASGVAVKATSGKFIFAQALEAAPANSAAAVHIVRAGKA